MTAEVLREAAALMRELAEAARRTEMPWNADEIGGVWAQENDGRHVLICSRATDEDAEHIASWHPAVALAVADWLEIEAEWVGVEDPSTAAPAVAVARAYMNSEVPNV